VPTCHRLPLLNWRGRSLASLQVIINPIGSSTTEQGLEIHAQLDKNQYKTEIKVTDEYFKTITIRGKRFHDDWSNEISPRKTV
jgi:Rhodopirellula transposase DDE domain